MPKEHRYIVYEYVTAWSEWEVKACNKAEAIAKARRREVENGGNSDSGGPNGKYDVIRDDSPAKR
jgi:hypothetical protein